MNKVRVTRLFHGSEPLGYMDPKVNMRVRHGTEPRWITAVTSGNYTVSLALASGGTAIASAYPSDLVVDTPVASGFGWPTSGGSILSGHSKAFPSGVPYVLPSGMSYMSGTGMPKLFVR